MPKAERAVAIWNKISMKGMALGSIGVSHIHDLLSEWMLGLAAIVAQA
jgi:hypothetical protein